MKEPAACSQRGATVINVVCENLDAEKIGEDHVRRVDPGMSETGNRRSGAKPEAGQKESGVKPKAGSKHGLKKVQKPQHRQRKMTMTATTR